MKTFFSKNARLIAMIFAIVVGLMLIVTATFMLTDYQDEISDRALSRSQYNASISSETFKDSMDEYNIHTASIASTAATFKDSLDLNDYLSSKSLTTGQEAPIDSIKDIRFYKNGVMYTTLGNVYEQEDPSLDHYKNNYDKVGYIGDYEDSDKVMTLVGFYAPVYNSTLLDAVVVYYTVDTLKNFYSPEQASELREFSILVDDEGNIIIGDTKDTEVLNIYNAYVGNIYNTLQSVLGKKTPADELKHIVDSKEDGAMKIVLLQYLLIVK